MLQLHDSSTRHTSDDLQNRGTKSDFLKFLEKFYLHDKYPQKLHLTDGLLIHQDLLNEGSFPYLILQKIMMYDDYRSLCKTKSELKIHPIDILLALLHCCDNFLRQDLLSRLLRCQLSFPFLLPNPTNKTTTLLLWAMRSVVCEWKHKQDATITPKESSIVNCKAPMILFLRIGNTKSPKDFSKSHTLNTVIGDQNYFCHWNCPGGNFDRKFVNGLVELSSYLPSGKDNDTFSRAVLFLNLRGEVRNHMIQFGFLKQIVFMAFLVLLEENLDDNVLGIIQELAHLKGGLVIICPNHDNVNSTPPLNITPDHVALNIRGENEDGIKSKIQKLISQKLSNVNDSDLKTISQCAVIARQMGIMVDEDDSECKEGYDLANSVISILDSVPETDAKAQLLPLQGSHLWHKWAKHDKETFQTPKSGKVTVNYYNQTLEQKKKEIRKTQYDKFVNPTALMKCFTDSLQKHNVVVRNYFLHWLKLFLDNRSREILPSIRNEYENIRAQLQKLRKDDKSEASATEKH